MEITEFIQDASLKVLRWNEKHPADQKGGILEPEGILMFRIHDKVQVLRNSKLRYKQVQKAGFSSRNNGLNYPPIIITSKVVLPILPFSESKTQRMFLENISSLNCFLSNNHRFLAKVLTFTFLTSFCFKACTVQPNRNSNPDSRSFKLVLVVDVLRKFVHVFPKSILLCQALSKQEEEEEEEGTMVRCSSEDYHYHYTDGFSKSKLRDILRILRYGKFPSYNQDRRPIRMFPGKFGPRELSQVKAATVKMSTAYGKKLEDGRCSICLDEFCKENRHVAVTPCSHIFHDRCVFKWILDKGSCPLCRRVCKSSI